MMNWMRGFASALLCGLSAVSVSAEGIRWPGADAAITEPRLIKFVGVARTLDGKVLFTEKHRITVVKGVVQDVLTEYTDGESETGKKIAEFRSDFQKSPYLPDYTYQDFRHGYENSLVYDPSAKKVSLKRRRMDEKVPKEETLKHADNMVAGQGVFFMVIAESASLENGDVKKVDFVVPTKLDDYGFRMYKVKDQSNEEKSTLRVDFDNWLFRMFAPKIEIVVDAKSKYVLEYRGASAVADEKFKFPEIVIRYKYDEVVK